MPPDHYTNTAEMFSDLQIVKDTYETCLIKLNKKTFNTYHITQELKTITELLKKIYNTLLMLHISAVPESNFVIFKDNFKKMTIDFEEASILAIQSTGNKKAVITILNKYAAIIENLANKKAVFRKNMFKEISIPLSDAKFLEE